LAANRAAQSAKADCMATGSTGMGISPNDLDAIAHEAFSLLDTGRLTTLFTHRHPGLAAGDAYKITSAVRAMRERRGEKPVGRKIGFTNRAVWDYAPMWGYMYDRTVHDLLAPVPPVSLAPFAEPRIEPEVVFGFRAAPRAGMSEREVLDCVEWAAHGFEIVQSIFAGWQFTDADAIAAYGVHGALYIGPRHDAHDGKDWERQLATFEIDLLRNDEVADHGRAANVLGGGPLTAVRFLLDEMARYPSNPPLAAGEIVTTGTLTKAIPIVSGDTCSTSVQGIGLEDLSLSFR
jgi:2-oxo-3-hexenedioate decarboxylase